MIPISELMALSEASTGFIGGAAVDYLPGMSLTEATAALPIAIMESQLEFYDMVEQNNTAMMEAVVNGIRYGGIDESALIAINEASAEGLGAKIKSFFEKILKFIRSVIEKLKFQINRIRMNGKQLWAKYKDSERARKVENFKDYKYNGYKNMLKAGDNGVNFAKASAFDGEDGGANLIKIAIGGDVNLPQLLSSLGSELAGSDYADDDAGKSAAEAAGKPFKDATEKLTEMDKDEIVGRMASQLCGEDGLDGSWQETIREKMYGDKEELEYGKDFNINQIGDLVSNPQDLEKIASEYKKFETSVNKYKTKLEKDVSAINKARDKSSNAGHRDVNSKASAFVSAYITRLGDAYGVISEVKNLRTTYYMSANDQATAILGQLLALGGKKSKKSDEASDFEDFEMYALEMD